MKNKIGCIYQDIINTSSMPSDLLPEATHDTTMHRLDIWENTEYDDSPLDYPALFSNFPLNVDWVIFSSEKVKGSSNNVINIWQRLLMMIDIFGLFHSGLVNASLYYIITNNLQEISKVSNTELWHSGKGLALPLEIRKNPDLLKEAIQLQVKPNNRLIPAIKLMFNCVINSQHDGAGVEIVWSDNWQYSSTVKEWALKLAKDLPLQVN